MIRQERVLIRNIKGVSKGSIYRKWFTNSRKRTIGYVLGNDLDRVRSQNLFMGIKDDVFEHNSQIHSNEEIINICQSPVIHKKSIDLANKFNCDLNLNSPKIMKIESTENKNKKEMCEMTYFRSPLPQMNYSNQKKLSLSEISSKNLNKITLNINKQTNNLINNSLDKHFDGSSFNNTLTNNEVKNSQKSYNFCFDSTEKLPLDYDKKSPLVIQHSDNVDIINKKSNISYNNSFERLDAHQKNIFSLPNISPLNQSFYQDYSAEETKPLNYINLDNNDEISNNMSLINNLYTEEKKFEHSKNTNIFNLKNKQNYYLPHQNKKSQIFPTEKTYVSTSNNLKICSDNFTNENTILTDTSSIKLENMEPNIVKDNFTSSSFSLEEYFKVLNEDLFPF